MKEFVKKILNRLALYHPLQTLYRSILFSFQKKKYRKIYRQYKGRGCTCNVCLSEYTKFVENFPLPKDKEAIEKNQVIAGYGPNVFCPNCLSTSRERLIIALLQNEFDVDEKKILHLAPEKNIYDYLKGKAEVITADISPGFYKNIDRLVQKQDITNLTFCDDTFDIVIGNHILEHIPDDNLAMKEIHRILKPLGIAILQIPYSEIIHDTLETPYISDPKLCSKLYGQKDHVRIYQLKNYLHRLQMAGFTVDLITNDELKKYDEFAIQADEHFVKITKAIS